MAVTRDKFGNRPGTRAARINAILSIYPKTTKQLERESGCKKVYEHLFSLLKLGLVERSKSGRETSWSLALRKAPTTRSSARI